MAIAYAQRTIYSRAKGKSSVAAAAYRTAERLVDHRTNEVHDYRKRDSHIYSEILLPEHAEKKFLNREYFWNAIETCEKRKDSQLAKDLLLALPKELNQTQWICLVREFSDQYFVSKGIPVDISIHDKKDGNPFAYILSTTRRLTGNQFSTHKARDLDPPFGNGFIKEKEFWSKMWGNFQDDYFKRNGIQLKVDEPHIVPQVHEGHISGNKVHYLKEENKLRKELSDEIIKKPERNNNHNINS